MKELLLQAMIALAYVGFVAVVVGAVLFILFYGFFVNWRKTPFGRHLFSFMLVLAAALVHDAVGVFVPAYRGSLVQMFVTFVLCWAMAWVVWWRLKILLTVQIGRRHDHRESIHTAEVSQVRNDDLGSAPAADGDLVEGVDPVGSGDERLGERGGALRRIPGSEGGS